MWLFHNKPTTFLNQIKVRRMFAVTDINSVSNGMDMKWKLSFPFFPPFPEGHFSLFLHRDKANKSPVASVGRLLHHAVTGGPYPPWDWSPPPVHQTVCPLRPCPPLSLHTGDWCDLTDNVALSSAGRCRVILLNARPLPWGDAEQGCNVSFEG